MKAAETKRSSIRTRIMWPMILLAAAALLVSGALVAVIQQRSVVENIDAQLVRTRDELKVLASKGVDPETGQQFRGPSELLRTSLERSVIGPGEGELGFVNGEVKWVASDDEAPNSELRLEEDQEFLAAIAPEVGGDEIAIKSVSTKQGNFRVLIAPVAFADERGALVHVYDMDYAQRELRRTMTVFAVVSIVTLGLIALAAWLVVGRLLKPIEELREAAESIDERDLAARVPVRGKDDLAALSSTVNRMLDRVQNSVEGQRQLLDDVGHELRTPITVVRGHMELIDINDPTDVAQTRSLVIEEVDRMGVLVNDLLMLAQASQSDFVQPKWTDLATLTDQTFEKAKALGERQWRLERVAAAEAWIDQQRITQAWLQLTANAVKYSSAGSPITLGSRLYRGEVWLWVRDLGIGIAPDQLELVRERFGRTREAASRAQGAGLGLSIVESIVSAHRGRLQIDSVHGEGSTFTIVLPLSNGELSEGEAE